MGLTIIAITIIVRLALYPSFQHQLRSQKKLTDLQPKLQEIKERHKDDREAQAKALMDFYKENKLNPFGSCLPMIVQLLILIALYKVFLIGLNGQVLGYLYAFVPDPGKINPLSLGFLDTSKPNMYLAFITGIAQFLQSKMMVKAQPRPVKSATGRDDFGTMMSTVMSKQFLYFFPILTVVIGLQLPAGLALYWLVSTVFAIGQQYFIMRSKSPVIAAGAK